jgi:hypothetical protein
MKATKVNFVERRLSMNEKAELEEIYPSWVEKLFWIQSRLRHGRRALPSTYEKGITAANQYWIKRCADIVNPSEVDIHVAFLGGCDCFETAFGLSDKEVIVFFSGFLFAIKKLHQGKATSASIKEDVDPSVAIYTALFVRWPEIQQLKNAGMLRSVRDLAAYLKPFLAESNPGFVRNLERKRNTYGSTYSDLNENFVNRLQQLCHRIGLKFGPRGRPKKRRKL